MPLRCVAYEPRAAERGVLYRVIEEHLERRPCGRRRCLTPMLPLPLDRPGHPTDDARTKHAPTKHLHWAWAHLMRRAFEIDVLACPRCGGRLRLIATVEDPEEIREVLAGLVLSAEPVDRAPPSGQSFAASPTADVCA